MLPCNYTAETFFFSFPVDHSIDFVAMDVAVNAAAGALKAFFADLPDPLIPYNLHPELVEAASKNDRSCIYVEKRKEKKKITPDGYWAQRKGFVTFCKNILNQTSDIQ